MLAAATATLLAAGGLAGQNASPAPQAAAAESLEQTFPFVGNELDITVAGQAAGTLRIVRGELGEIRLVAHALGGTPAAAMGSNADPAKLTLDSGPAAHVDYVLIVPAQASISARLAGHPAATLAPTEPTGGWSWPAQSAESLPSLPQ